MEKSVFSPLYRIFREALRGMRREARLSQRRMADRLGREQNLVARIELGERRVDFVEFFWVCRALGKDPEETAAVLMREFKRLERGREGNRKRPTVGHRSR